MQIITRNLGISAVLMLALAPRPARADLTGDFADALAMDPDYLTDVTGATDIAFAADGRAVVTQKSGTITIRLTDGTKNVLNDTFMDVDTNSEKGLTGVVADPTEPNAFFFYCDNGPTDDKHRVYRGVLNDDNTLTVDTMNPIVAAGKNPGDPGLEGPANHDGGGLFVYDNHLYVGVGDTGANSTPPTNKYSSCLNKGNGKILRLNLDGSIPSDNPLVGVNEVTACDDVHGAWGTDAPDTRIFAWGFRNPWRFFVDSHTGRMWIGDVGETTREEVSVSAPADGYEGEHFGYPFVEGSMAYPHTEPDDDFTGKNCDMDFAPSRECTGPVHDYDNDSQGNCVIGGIIPEGCGWANAFGGTLYYFFSDNGQAWLHALEVKPDRSGVVSGDAVDAGSLGNSTGPASIRQGPGGAMYVVLNRGNAVFEIKPKDQTGDDCQSMGGSGGSGGEPSGSAGEPSGSGGDPSGEAGAGTGGVTTAGTSGRPAAGSGSGGRSGSGSGGTSAGRAGNASSGTGGTGTAGTSSGGDSPPEDDGCGCRVAGQDSGSLAGLFAALGLGAGVFARRRARARQLRR